MRATFQTQFFLAALTTSILALGVAGLLFAATMRHQVDKQIESTLTAETRLAADLIGSGSVTQKPSTEELQDEAVRIRRLLDARVTFIAADGHVVGDSFEKLADLGSMENHAERPEELDARATGIGRARQLRASVN